MSGTFSQQHINSVNNYQILNQLELLTGKPTSKMSLRRPSRSWEDSVRMDLKEIGINTRNWVDSAQDRDYWRALVGAILNLQVPKAMELVINQKSKNVFFY